MKRLLTLLTLFVCLLALGSPSPAQDKKELGRARISLYRIAPGKHLDFLKWMAAREDVDKEAGIPATQWYAHTDGDDWDYVGVGPVTTAEQDKKSDEIAKKKGLTVGFAASLEFRQYVGSHSDTFAMGPTSATDLVSRSK
jgi:hypothetical protein